MKVSMLVETRALSAPLEPSSLTASPLLPLPSASRAQLERFLGVAQVNVALAHLEKQQVALDLLGAFQ